MADNPSKPAEFHRMTATEFARLSSSRQLALLAIRRAQLSSRKAISATAVNARRDDSRDASTR